MRKVGVGRKQRELKDRKELEGIILVLAVKSFRVQICQLPAKQTIFCAINMYFIIKNFNSGSPCL